MDEFKLKNFNRFVENFKLKQQKEYKPTVEEDVNEVVERLNLPEVKEKLDSIKFKGKEFGAFKELSDEEVENALEKDSNKTKIIETLKKLNFKNISQEPKTEICEVEGAKASQTVDDIEVGAGSGSTKRHVFKSVSFAAGLEYLNSLSVRTTRTTPSIEPPVVIPTIDSTEQMVAELRTKMNSALESSPLNYFNEYFFSSYGLQSDITEFLKAKYNYSDDYANFVCDYFMLCLDGNQISKSDMPQVIDKYIELISTNDVFKIDVSSNDTPISMIDGSNRGIVRYNLNNNKDIIRTLFSRLLGFKIYYSDNYELYEALFENVKKEINIKLGNSENTELKWSDLALLDTNNDGNWSEELYNIICQKFDAIAYEVTEYDSTKIYPNAILNGEDSISLRQLSKYTRALANSNYLTVRHIANTVLGAHNKLLDENANDYIENGKKAYGVSDFGYYGCMNVWGSFIKLLNQRLGIETTYPLSITNETISRLNACSDISAVIEEITSSQTFYEEAILGLDCELNDVYKQGHTGDCWLIATLVALNATEKGREKLREITHYNDDGSITFDMKGVKIVGDNGEFLDDLLQITVTKQQIYEAIQSYYYAHGDCDVIAIELAVQQVRQGIVDKIYWNGDSSVKYDNVVFDTSEDISAALRSGYQEEALSYFLGDDFSDSEPIFISALNYQTEVLKYIDKECCLYFDLAPELQGAWTVDGKKYFEYPGQTVQTSHAFGITKITENTVTVVNPWDSSDEYEISWEDFFNLKTSGAYGIVLE